MGIGGDFSAIAEKGLYFPVDPPEISTKTVGSKAGKKCELPGSVDIGGSNLRISRYGDAAGIKAMLIFGYAILHSETARVSGKNSRKQGGAKLSYTRNGGKIRLPGLSRKTEMGTKQR